MDRRDFLKKTAAIAGASVIAKSSPASGAAKESLHPGRFGVLVDTTFCIGCRRCEWACNEWNRNSNMPMKTYDDKSVFAEERRTHASTFTVVNRFQTTKGGRPVYVKKQCMHCEDPACVSACFVDAFRKTSSGAVVYDPDVCVGCRYCMVACPFDIPAYEYDDPITPKVTKCTLCFDRISEAGKVPACVEQCPTETLRFGKREELIQIATERIITHPSRYVNQIYGEHEAGGTGWLYLSSVPFEEIGFRTDLGTKPAAAAAKGYLFSVKTFEIVAAWPLVFAAFYAMSKMRKKNEEPVAKENNGEKHGKK